MIAFSCNNCARRLEADDQHAGRKAKCPACRALVLVPQEPTDMHGAGVDVSQKPAERSQGKDATPGRQSKPSALAQETSPPVTTRRGRPGMRPRPRRASPRRLIVLLLLGIGLVVAVCSGLMAIFRYGQFGIGRVDVRKVIANPQAYAGRTLVSRVRMVGAHGCFEPPFAHGGVPLRLKTSPALQDKAWRIMLAGSGSVMMRYKVHDKQTWSERRSAGAELRRLQDLAEEARMGAFDAERAAQRLEGVVATIEGIGGAPTVGNPRIAAYEWPHEMRYVHRVEEALRLVPQEMMSEWRKEEQLLRSKKNALREVAQQLGDARRDADKARGQVSTAANRVMRYEQALESALNRARNAETPRQKSSWAADAESHQGRLQEARAELQKAKKAQAEAGQKVEMLKETASTLGHETAKAKEALLEKASSKLAQAASKAEALREKAKAAQDAIDRTSKSLPYGAGVLLDIWIP